jgi:putative intracellular protease/amidase
MNSKGKIAVLIEDHFDQTEFRMFNDFFPRHGYEVEYVTHLWGNRELHFRANPDNGRIEEQVTVNTEINDVRPSDYKGIILIGAYAMDRLRYQTHPKKGQPNQAPAVDFIRRAMHENAKIGTLCHSLWLLCADRSLLERRRVTCAHNIVCDVENAGAEVVFEGDGTAELVVDGNLITGKHPGITTRFMEAFIREIELKGIPATRENRL